MILRDRKKLLLKLLLLGGPESGNYGHQGRPGEVGGSGPGGGVIQPGQGREGIEDQLRGLGYDKMQSGKVTIYTKDETAFHVKYDSENKVAVYSKVTNQKPSTDTTAKTAAPPPVKEEPIKTSVLPPVKEEPKSLDQPTVPKGAGGKVRQQLIDMFKQAGSEKLSEANKNRINQAAAMMAKAGLNPELIQGLNSVADSQASGVRGLYVQNQIQLNPHTADPNTVIHEYGHHVDLGLLNGGRSRLTEEGTKLYGDTKKEWDNAKSVVERKIGMTFGGVSAVTAASRAQFRIVESKMSSIRVPAVSNYALYNHKEWMAESFTHYVSNPSNLYEKAPATYKFFYELNTGGILKK